MAFYGKLTHDWNDNVCHRLTWELNVTAEGEPDLRKQLAAKIRARRDELGLSQQALADQAGVGVNTIIRMEQADFAERRTKTWGPIEEALGWTPRYFDRYLAGEAVDGLESRYQRDRVIDAGRPVDVVEDALYKVFMAGAPGTPLEEFDRVRRRVFDVLHEAGIDVARRNVETSSGTDEEA